MGMRTSRGPAGPMRTVVRARLPNWNVSVAAPTTCGAVSRIEIQPDTGRPGALGHTNITPAAASHPSE